MHKVDLGELAERESATFVYTAGPFDDLWGHLELAAIRLSDALTGGGVHAVHGAASSDILCRVAERDRRLIDSLSTLNRILREMDKRRKEAAPAQEKFMEAAARLSTQQDGG